MRKKPRVRNNSEKRAYYGRMENDRRARYKRTDRNIQYSLEHGRFSLEDTLREGGGSRPL
jgi:hypothetical protein